MRSLCQLMGALTKRADGRFTAKYHGKFFYGSTAAEARRKRDEYKAREMMGITEPSRVTVSSYAAKWLPTAKASVEVKVYNEYANLLDKLVSVIGTMPMADVTPTDVKSVYNTLLGKSDSTVRKLKMLSVAMFDAAVEDGLIRVNPARSKSAKPHKGTVGSHRILTHEEITLVHETDHRCRLMALTMLYAGLRRGEALAIDIDRDIDQDAGWIHVTQAVRYDSNRPILTDPKTEAGTRDIPLLTPLADALRGHHGLLMPSSDGQICSETAFSRAWESYMTALSRAANGGIPRRWWGRTQAQKNKADLPPYREISLRCHDFRHTYATTLCDAGVDLHIAIQWLGHADEKMILQIYDHVTASRITTARSNLEIFLGSQNGSQNSERSPLSLVP